MARTAETEGIPPASPWVVTEAELQALGRKWIHTPYVAAQFPTLLAGEYQAVETAIRDIRDGTRDLGWDAGCQAGEQELDEARKLDPLPSPDRLTLGDLIDALRVQEMAYPAIGTSKIIFEQYNRRSELLAASPGFAEFRHWANSELGQNPTFKAAEEFLSRLARRIKRAFEEARGMLLIEAVRLIRQSNETADAGHQPSGPTMDSTPKAHDLESEPDSADTTEEIDTNRRVAEFLGSKPSATSKEIGDAIGKADQTVRRTPAWAEHQNRRRAQRSQKSVPTRGLTDAMLNSIRSRSDDPADIVANRELAGEGDPIESKELLKRRYLEDADAKQRANFHKMSAAEQELEIEAWIRTGDRVVE
jgi:hypothetical protein